MCELTTFKNPRQGYLIRKVGYGSTHITINKPKSGYVDMRTIKHKRGDTIGDYGVTYFKDAGYRDYGEIGKRSRLAVFKCPICGRFFTAIIQNVKQGNTRSCGCLIKKRAENSKGVNFYDCTTHGMSYSKIYGVYRSIKSRCYNKAYKDYKYYGERGIKLCDEWRYDFMMFYSYVKTLPHYGEKGYSLDRINNDGNYEPKNVRWATNKTQSINRRKPWFSKEDLKSAFIEGRYGVMGFEEFLKQQ